MKCVGHVWKSSWVGVREGRERKEREGRRERGGEGGERREGKVHNRR